VIFSQFVTVFSWGPVSHLFFADILRQFFLPPPGYKQGADAPDAFYFANFAQFPTCEVPIENMHNLVTAGYFLQYTLVNHSPLEYVAIAAGFGSHMIADYVGFHPRGGLLGSTVPSYVSTFPYMTAIDALVLSMYPNLDISDPWETVMTAQFLANCTAYYHQQEPTFPQYTTTEIANCILPWSDTIYTIAQLAQIQSKSVACLEPILLLLDPFFPPNIGAVTEHFNGQAECVAGAISAWYSAIRDGNTTPKDAAQLVYSYVDNAYISGKCTKPTSSDIPIEKQDQGFDVYAN